MIWQTALYPTLLKKMNFQQAIVTTFHLRVIRCDYHIHTKFIKTLEFITLLIPKKYKNKLNQNLNEYR
jgi:hypothetical protein